MEKRNLGKTKLKTSEIGLGCRSIGGKTIINGKGITFGNISQKKAEIIIKKALELGINTFDTADTYSLGNSEIRLGNILKEYRKSVNIFTKAGAIPQLSNIGFNYEIDLSYNHLLSAIDRSLNRLKTDYIDLFQTHAAPKSKKDFEDVKKAFVSIKKDGKARYCGVSVGLDYENGIKLINQKIVDVLQISYSIFSKKSVDPILKLARKEGIGIIVNRPFAEGFISDNPPKIIFKSFDARSRYSKTYIQKNLERVKKMNRLKKKLKISISQIALAYTLHRNEISICIPSVSNNKQLSENIKSTKITLSKSDLKEIQLIKMD